MSGIERVIQDIDLAAFEALFHGSDLMLESWAYPIQMPGQAVKQRVDLRPQGIARWPSDDAVNIASLQLERGAAPHATMQDFVHQRVSVALGVAIVRKRLIRPVEGSRGYESSVIGMLLHRSAPKS